MESNTNIIKNCIYSNEHQKIRELLGTGLDPNYEGGWPIRLAARYGSYSIVKIFLHHGANPHLLGDSGASTLQLAVFSEKHWETDRWSFLLSCCDSSQLADGAAVAIVFHNIPAFMTILKTGRCNTNIPTTLTGKTVEQLAKGYKLDSLLSGLMLNAQTSPLVLPRNSRQNRTSIRTALPPQPQNAQTSPLVSPINSRQNRTSIRTTLTPQTQQRNLSPSVARFFNQTAGQSTLTVQRSPIFLNSPPTPERA